MVMELVLLRATNLYALLRVALLGDGAGRRWMFRASGGWLGGTKIADWCILWICSAFVLMGTALLVESRILSVSERAAGWPTVIGKVVFRSA
jgi:hypothetical protein